MPNAAPKPCSHPGCGILVRDGSSRCSKHPREPWHKSKPTKRVTGRKLQELRHALFTREPLCVMCKANGLVVLATVRDHITPLAEGGADKDDNTQGLCHDCHDGKSLAEAARGAARWGRGRG